MTDSPITLTDLATLAAVAGAVFAGVRFLVDYLTSKFNQQMTPAEQSAQCRFDHDKLGSVLAQQNANMSRQNDNIYELLKQNGEQIKALADANHAAQLRHQIVLSHLESQSEKLSEIKKQIDRK